MPSANNGTGVSGPAMRRGVGVRMALPSGPSANVLDFATLTPAALASRFGWVRTGDGRMESAAGLLVPAPQDGATYLMRTPDYSFGVPGLLLEGQRTNQASSTENLAHASYNAFATTVTTGATPPGNIAAACKLIEGSGIQLRGQLMAVVSGTAYTQSVFAKAAERQYLVCRNQDSSRFAVINLATGAVHNAGSGFTLSVYPLPAGWYRVACSFTSTVTGNVEYQWGISDDGTLSAGNYDDYVGTAGYGLFLTGTQFEAGAYPTSYIPNPGTGTVTRAADVAEIGPGAEFDSLFGVPALGPELIPAGAGDGTSAAGWRGYLATSTVSGGEFVATTAGGDFPQAIYDLPGLTVGKRYRISCTARRGTISTDVYMGWKSGESARTASVTNAVLTLDSVADATTMSISVGAFGNTSAGQTWMFDNISVREVTREGTIVVEWVGLGASVDGDLLTLHAAGSIAESMAVYLNGGVCAFFSRAGGTNQLTPSLGTPNATGVNRVAFSWGASGLAAVLNGGTVYASAGATLPAPTHARFAGATLVQGSQAAWKPTKITTLPDQKTGAALQALTV